MIVQMPDGLSGVFPVIDDHAEPFFYRFFLTRHRLHHLMDVCNLSRMTGFQGHQGLNMLFGYNQDMHRGSWSDVPER